MKENAMKILISLLPSIFRSNALALSHKAQIDSSLTPFAFLPPELEKPAYHFAPPRPYKRRVPQPEHVAALRENVISGLDDVQGELEEELGGTPSVDQMEKEKEEKARSKGNFLTKLIEEASKIFSVIHFWYKWEKRYGQGGSQSRSQETASAQGAPKESSLQFQNEVLEDLRKGEKSEPLAMSDVQDLEKAMRPSIFNQPVIRECVRDYSVQCPEGFSEHATECIAPSDYTGPCGKRQPELYLLSNTAKASWSWTCKANYPCMPEKCPAGADYSQPCPVGWNENLNGRCSTDDDTSQCDQKISAAADPPAKAAWEGACAVRWPCKKRACVKDFSVNCPAEWVDMGSGLCKAPSTYRGPCPSKMDLNAYKGKSDLKRALELRCDITWLCKASTYERERDYTVSCPLGWAELEDSSCQAPPSYTPSTGCPRSVSFAGRSAPDRQSFAALCRVDFPFRGNRCTTLKSRQAVKWVDSGNGGWCQAPASYAGSCPRLLNLTELTDQQKQMKMSECSLEWPCVGESREFTALRDYTFPSHVATKPLQRASKPFPPATKKSGPIQDSGEVYAPASNGGRFEFA